MIRIPSRCPGYFGSQPRTTKLAEAALAFRKEHKLLNPADLACYNITAWLYLQNNQEKIVVCPNIPISTLKKQFGKAPTPRAEVGIHSEGQAADFIYKRGITTVLQIFTERIPCGNCKSLLDNYFPGIPIDYYYNGASCREVTLVGEGLFVAYGLSKLSK